MRKTFYIIGDLRHIVYKELFWQTKLHLISTFLRFLFTEKKNEIDFCCLVKHDFYRFKDIFDKLK